MIQDYMLFLFASHIVFTGYAWGVWGLLACSLLAPPIMVHASLRQIVLAWCEHFSLYDRGWWTKPSIPCCLSKVTENNHDWNTIVSTFLSDHDPSGVMGFYQIFDRIPEEINGAWNGGVSSVARLMRSSIAAGSSLSKGMVKIQ
jgi:hypothetical protein